jgi:integrase
MMLLAAWCVLRFGELAKLRRRAIDVKNRVIHVRRGVTSTKGSRIVGDPKSHAGKRDVAIPPHLMPLVRSHLGDHAQIVAWSSPEDCAALTRLVRNARRDAFEVGRLNAQAEHEAGKGGESGKG